jgi:hypothetical protein
MFMHFRIQCSLLPLDPSHMLHGARSVINRVVIYCFRVCQFAQTIFYPTLQTEREYFSSYFLFLQNPLCFIEER